MPVFHRILVATDLSSASVPVLTVRAGATRGHGAS